MIAELTDNVGWELLIGLAQEMGQTDIVSCGLSGPGWWMEEDHRMPWEPGWGDLPDPPMGWVVPCLATGRPILLVGRLRELGFIYPVEGDEVRP